MLQFWGDSMSNQLDTTLSQLNVFFCEVVVPMDVSILAKFCRFMVTGFWGVDIQICQKICLLGTS
jgi:hypothetical protein